MAYRAIYFSVNDMKGTSLIGSLRWTKNENHKFSPESKNAIIFSLFSSFEKKKKKNATV